MLFAIEIPGSVIIFSETIYPTFVRLLRHEIIPLHVFGQPVNVMNAFICIWIVGAVYLIAKLISSQPSLIYFVNWIGRSKRDEDAEKLLADIIGYDKHFRIFRKRGFSSPKATAFKPYIILPEIDFTPDELRVILLHEWKHIQDKDYLTGNIVEIICFVFWWNPLVYVLRRNFHFAQELKCDQFAVTNNMDFSHYIKGFLVVHDFKKQKEDCFHDDGASAFIDDEDEIMDRFKVLAMRDNSRSKRIFANACFSVIIFIVFIASYMFIVFPAVWVPDVPMVESFTEEYVEIGGIFKAEENFVVDNDDGTFSLYIDGQFVRYVDSTFELLDFLPVRERE